LGINIGISRYGKKDTISEGLAPGGGDVMVFGLIYILNPGY
jgi:hypothetical protein